MLNTKQRKIIGLILLVFSLFMIIGSASAADIALTKSQENSFKSTIESSSTTSGSSITLIAGTEYSLNSANVNVAIDKNLTIKSSSSSQNAIINLNNYDRAFNVNYSGKLTLINITIKNGNTTGNGGAIYNSYGDVKLTGCSFSSNTATGEGGAIYSWNANYTISSCSFSSNTANAGGAICNNGGAGTLSLSGSSFSANTASGQGGAISNAGNCTIKGSSFSANVAGTSAGAIISGGGSDTLSISDSSFSANIASSSSGAIYSNTNCTVSYCNFSNNNASVGNGGAIAIQGYCSISYCNFLVNTAANYGAAISNNGNCTISACSFSANNATIYGGAIYNDVNGNCTVTYSIFVNNVGYYEIYNGGIIPVVANYNWWGSNNNPQGKYGPNVLVDNYYVMSISTSVANSTCYVGDNLAVNYNFVLNGTNNNADAATKFALFTVGIVLNGNLWSNIAGYKSAQYNIPLSGIDNTITAKLNSEVSTVNYKALQRPPAPPAPPAIVATTLVVNNLKPLFNKANVITVTARDKNGNLLANKNIGLYVNGKLITTAKTNSAGVASFIYTFKLRSAHKIIAKFTGDTTHAASDSVTLSLTPKDKTIISLAKFTAKYNKKATLKVILKNHKNKVMANKVVRFYANNKLLGQAKTNAKGVATLTKKITTKGSVNFVAKYAGDKTYHDSNANRKIIVK